MNFEWQSMDSGQDMDGLWLDTELGLGQTTTIDLASAYNGQLHKLSGDPVNAASTVDLASTYDDQMQKLALLSGKLFTQINQHHDEVNPMVNIEKLTGHVISSSSSLLDILKSLGATLAREHQNVPGYISTAFSSDTENNTIDSVTTLHVLSAYIRLTQLHYKLYKSIHALVSTPTSASPANSGSVSPTLSAFSTLEIGGTSLAPYARFQLKFLLQICAHHLGEIEVLLGLPAGFRVSEQEHGDNEGDFCEIMADRKGGHALLVQAIMMGSGTPVKEIGETLERLKKALEGRIQV